MKTIPFLSCLAAAQAITFPPAEHVFANSPTSESTTKIPTSYESAVMGRRILALTKLATFSTVFPDSHSNQDSPATQERRPEGLEGIPIGMMDYIADCEDGGNPSILAINIATTFKNVRAGSNISVSLHWTPPYPPSQRISLSSFFSFSSSAPDTVPFSAANLPRLSLLGTLEPISADPVAKVKLASCFVKTHPDAKYWLPGNPIHESEWVRLVVKKVYWVGGFGDRAYIGWIPVEEWSSVTKEEWQGIELPGERKGWHEWALGSWAGGDL